MENNEENNKIEINGRQYYNLEEVPEPFRAALQERIDAARAANPDKPADGSSKIAIHKDFQFQGGPGLSAFLKFLIKMAPPPPATPRAPRPTGFATPEERPGTPYDTPQPGAIKPTSSGMLVWVILIGIAVFYIFFVRIK